MAKRFTDSRKWLDPWFRELPQPYRDLWLYMLDNCSHIGIWKVDMGMASYVIGGEVRRDMAQDLFNNRVIDITGETSTSVKWFIPKFVSFQYGVLSPDGRLHSKIIRDLEIALPADVFSRIQTECQHPVTKGDVTLKSKEEVKDIYRELIECWNSKKLPKILTLSKERKAYISTRFKSQHFRDNWKKALDKMDSSSFCQGKNDRKWKTDVDWFIKNDTNYLKALEGKYDDKAADRFSKY